MDSDDDGYWTPDYYSPCVSLDSEDSSESLTDDSYITDTITFIKIYNLIPIFFVNVKIENTSLNQIKKGVVKTKNLAILHDKQDKEFYKSFPINNDNNCIGLNVYTNNSHTINNYKNKYSISWSLNFASIKIESDGYYSRNFDLDWVLENIDNDSYNKIIELDLIPQLSIFELENFTLKNVYNNVIKYEKCLHLNDPITLTTVESYNINYFALCDALSPYLCSSLHGIRKISITCKEIYAYYLNYTIPKLNPQTFLEDALEHNCKYCIKLLQHEYINLIPNLTSFAFSKQLNSITLLDKNNSYLRGIISDDQIEEFALLCVNSVNNVILVNYLVANFRINSIKILKIIVDYMNLDSINKYVNSTYITHKHFKILLPSLCLYNMEKIIMDHLYDLDDNTCDFLITHITNNMNLWAFNNVHAILSRYLTRNTLLPNENIKNFIIKFIIENKDVELMCQLINNPNRIKEYVQFIFDPINNSNNDTSKLKLIVQL